MAVSAERIKPRPSFPKGFKKNPAVLAAGRYGTPEMCEIFGDERTFEHSLRVQGQAALTLSILYPNLISSDIAQEIYDKASLKFINPDRIREIEASTNHDVIGINTSLEEVVSDRAKPHINQFKTSADTTVPAKALQMKKALEVIAETTENLRDILIEKSLDWIDIPFMVQTHGYDALPAVAGRPFAHYAEMLQSGLRVLKFFYKTSIIGKWADVTGDHHAATSSSVDGVELQKRYCKDLGIGFMDAPAQIPGLEFEADVAYSLVRIGMTVDNIARYIAWGRSDDVNLFVYSNPDKRKGSSGMPHKDAKGGNPIDEEQAVSVANKLLGFVVTALSNCEMPYARALYASANSRIDLEDCFKFFDYNMRRFAAIAYNIELRKERSIERVLRSRGVVTSPQVLTYLTGHSTNPMAWREAHDLLGKCSTEAWNNGRMFYDVLMKESAITSRITPDKLKDLTEPLKYLGRSKEIVELIASKYHGVKTFNKSQPS